MPIAGRRFLRYIREFGSPIESDSEGEQAEVEARVWNLIQESKPCSESGRNPSPIQKWNKRKKWRATKEGSRTKTYLDQNMRVRFSEETKDKEEVDGKNSKNLFLLLPFFPF